MIYFVPLNFIDVLLIYIDDILFLFHKVKVFNENFNEPE
jgi:hypothetical protein